MLFINNINLKLLRQFTQFKGLSFELPPYSLSQPLKPVSTLFVLLGVSRDLNVAAFMLPAPCLASLGPLAIFVVKTALFTLI